MRGYPTAGPVTRRINLRRNITKAIAVPAISQEIGRCWLWITRQKPTVNPAIRSQITTEPVNLWVNVFPVTH
jgi:hypothetical protein